MNDVIRHFTATAVILDDGRVLLIDHPKLGWWLPPGGHVEPNEDPVQAVRREVREEVGLEVDLVTDDRFSHPAVGIVAPPFTILVEDIPDPRNGDHQHIDMVYVATPRAGGGAPNGEHGEYPAARWVPLDEVATLSVPPELPALVEACAHYASTQARN